MFGAQLQSQHERDYNRRIILQSRSDRPAKMNAGSNETPYWQLGNKGGKRLTNFKRGCAI